ncbi:MAG: HAD-IIB family hydrolase [Bacilli bacterium]|nr:HAD-IIB family hydrolase [Bacilli bacterium]
MEYKLIAMDFDGTLLNDQKKITNKTRDALKGYKDYGYIIVGVTARNLGSIKSVCDDMSFFDYLILNNGGYIYNIEEKKGEYQSIIQKEDIKNITDEMRGISRQIDYCAASIYYLYLTNEEENEFIKIIQNISDIKERIIRMNIFLLDEVNIECCRDDINDRFKNINCFIMQNSNDDKKWLVLNPKGINKKTTLKKLGQNLGFKLEDMIFFGDGLNDVELISSVGLGVAMENALDEVKNCAKEITKDNNNDGIEYFLNKHISLKEL